MGTSKEKRSKPPVTLGKLLILALGVIVVCLGIHSHLESAWHKKYFDKFNTTIRAYEFLDKMDLSEEFALKPPSIYLERYFLIVVLICFLLSLGGLAVGLLLNLRSRPLKLTDMAYHIAAGAASISAGIVFIISTLQIDKLVHIDEETDEEYEQNGVYFLKKEKLAAGSLAIVQGVFYGIVAIMIGYS